MFTRLDPDHRHVSRRSSVYARNVVAASQPLATQAGVQILQNGGTVSYTHLTLPTNREV